MPLSCLFIGMSHTEEAGFVERLSDDLKPDRQVPGGEAAGHGDGREAGEVEGISKTRAKVLLVGIQRIEGFGWTGGRGRGKQVDL